ncbi:MAG: shikimate dehydrogenase [Nitratiruptor sp.]|nr:shikimate dehydrogenase [Nitratiruptor sp.]NPA83969.1 shikimate dehydrogenase [Campylobacterota bacterium]
MRLFTIFGNPVHHSISPIIHNYTFQHLGYRGCYTRTPLSHPSQLRPTFFQKALSGANITLPYKEAAFAQADEVRGIAREIEAVNTWVVEDGKIVGYNTDAPGFFESVKDYDFQAPLILGAGGTAKAIALYLRHKGFDPVVLNRSRKRLDYFLQRGIRAYSWEDFPMEGSYDLIVNTTSAGLEDDRLPAPKELLEPLLRQARYGVDVIYKRQTPFLRLAQSFGLQTQDGSGMLLHQGVLAFDHFTKGGYPIEEIRTLMARAMELT